MRVYVPKSNEYHLDKHRYLELRSFCLQYPAWSTCVKDCYGLKAISGGGVRSSSPSNPTAQAAEAADKYRRKMEMVEKAAREADPYLYKWIMLNVTTGSSYDIMCRRGNGPPCGVNQFYRARQKFFYLLSAIKE